jgi:hypothetical protein
MAESLTSRDGALVVRDGSLVTTTNGEPCPECCKPGPTEPCGPSTSSCTCPGGSLCPDSSTREAFLQYHPLSGGVVIVYSVPQVCCCAPRALRTVTYNHNSFVREVIAVPGGLQKDTIRRWTITASGPANAVQRHVRIHETGTLNGSPVNNLTEFDDVVDYNTCYGPSTAAFGGNSAADWGGGYIRADCDTREDAFRYFNDAGSPWPQWTAAGGYTIGTLRRIPMGHICYPATCTTGACCCNGVCYSNVSPAQCIGMGGTFMGSGSSCAEVECEERGSCCVNGECIEMPRGACELIGGVFTSGPCSANPCPPFTLPLGIPQVGQVNMPLPDSGIPPELLPENRTCFGCGG